jgi:hypothetical protein
LEALERQCLEAQAPGEQRRLVLAAVYRHLAAESSANRERGLRSMIEAESALDDQQLRALTADRLNSWLALDGSTASCIARSYDDVMATMAAGPAMRRVAVVQSLVSELPLTAQTQLRELIPEEVCGPAMSGAVSTRETRLPAPIPWWAFWRRSGPSRNSTSGDPASSSLTPT